MFPTPRLIRFSGLLVSLVLLTSVAWCAPPLPGTIFTTDSTCTSVNLNLYNDKTAVYLNGGPAHPGAASLPDGSYYLQVTEPNGTVLGSSVGAANPTPVVILNGDFTSCLQVWASVVKTSDASVGYDDTTNPGGEYKVWVSSDSAFQNSSTKTDNFKVFATPPPPSTISGLKFYDANVNGIQDNGETGIPGWHITIFGDDGTSYGTTTVQANTGGAYSFMNLGPGFYGVCEVIPSGGQNPWVNTTPTVIRGISVPPDSTNNNFGNVCLGAGGGLTLGFWSNKNGQNLITAAGLCTLTGLNLVNGSGAAFDPVPNGSTTSTCPNLTNTTAISSGKTALKNFLLSATATNMAYMLSAQLATMKLNVLGGFVDPNAIVYAPGVHSPPANAFGFISISDLMTEANASLAAHPVTKVAGVDRSYQEALKNALDQANNNNNFVQPSASACEISYSASEPSCVPAQ